jgi:hypothetical protein
MTIVALSPGDRIGALTLIGISDPREEPSGRIKEQWLAECDCGRKALRLSHQLRAAKKSGAQPCCQVCLEQLRRGVLLERDRAKQSTARRRSKNWAQMFRKTGSMYDGEFYGGIDRCFSALPSPGSMAVPVPVELSVAGLGNSTPPQQDQWLFRIRGKGGWLCSVCGKLMDRGYGCVRCLDRVCSKCFVLGAHSCRSKWEDTWCNESPGEGLLKSRLNKLNNDQLVDVTVGKNGRTILSRIETLRREVLTK